MYLEHIGIYFCVVTSIIDPLYHLIKHPMIQSIPRINFPLIKQDSQYIPLADYKRWLNKLRLTTRLKVVQKGIILSLQRVLPSCWRCCWRMRMHRWRPSHRFLLGFRHHWKPSFHYLLVLDWVQHQLLLQLQH